MDFSLREKSIWGSLIATTVVGAIYFSEFVALIMRGTPPRLSEIIGNGLGAIILLVIIEIVLQTIIALSSRDEEPDERDRLIAAKGERFANAILITGMVLAVSFMAFTNVVKLKAPDDFITAHILIFSAVLSELVKFARQLLAYRTGW